MSKQQQIEIYHILEVNLTKKFLPLFVNIYIVLPKPINASHSLYKKILFKKFLPDLTYTGF